MHRFRYLFTPISLIVLLLISNIFINTAQAQEEPLTAAEAMAIVDEEDRLEPELREATPADAELIYVLDGTEFITRYWLVLLTNADGQPVGVVGIDPYTGEFGLEHFVDGRYRFPRYDPERTGQLLFDNGYDPNDYLLDGARLLWLGGKVKANVWFIPHQSGEFYDALALTAFDRNGKLYEYLPLDPLFETEQGEVMYPLVILSEHYTQSDWTMDEDETFNEESPQDVTPLAETSGQVTTLASGSNNGEYWDTDLVPDVPFYQQGNTQWCALFSLSMLHQWWSPVPLGTGRSQAGELANFLGHNTNQGTTIKQMKDIITGWFFVNANYQDFYTTYAGVGQAIQDGSPSHKTDDLKSWITDLDAPVTAAVDSDGNGSKPFAATDHIVLVIGYDDRSDKVTIHNSGAFLGKSGRWASGTVSYNDWNNKYWNAQWWPSKNYGMVAGIPGDMDRASISSYDGDILGNGTVFDDERAQAANISLTVGSDDAMESTDPFGEAYETKVRVRLSQGTGVFENETLGDFDRAGSPNLTFYHSTGLSQGDSLSGAGVYIDPTDSSRGSLGQSEVEFRYTLYDKEDRYHYLGPTIVISNDLGSGKNNTSRMPKPILNRDSERLTRSYTVTDDDTTGPLFTDPLPPPSSTITDPNWPAGDFPLQIDVQDPSSIKSIALHYTIYDLPGETIVYSDKVSLIPQGTSATYQYDVPRSRWYNQDKIDWWLEATDDDNDRPNDEASARSVTYTVYLTDDDTDGPAVTDHDDKAELVTVNQQEKVQYTFKVKLSDPSGVLDDATYPNIYYRWNNQEVTESLNDGSVDADYDGTWYTATVMADLDRRDETLYWRVLAKDTDDDRSPSEDRATSWSQTFQVDVPAALCVTPTPVDHDFGPLSNVRNGNNTAQWPFTIENCGGASLTVFGGVENRLQNTTGSTPQCPLAPGHCWLGVSGIPQGGQTLYGGEQHTVTVRINTAGFDHQVPALVPGEYQGQIKFDGSSAFGTTTISGTIAAAIPQITVTRPVQNVTWEPGQTHTITWQSDYLPPGANVKLELGGPSPQVIDSSAPDTGLYTWSLPPSGLQNGQYRVHVNPVGLPTLASPSERFWIGNAPPHQPANLSPAAQAGGVSSTPALTSSSFSDPNAGDVHQASWWQLRTDTFGSSMYRSPLWDSTPDPANLESITVPSGTLPALAAADRQITVQVNEHAFRPNQLTVRRGQEISLTLENTGQQTHRLSIPELEVLTPPVNPGGSATVAFTPPRAGEFSFYCPISNHQALGESGTMDVAESTFWWRVRHQDDQGAWSSWSAETSFSTVYKPPASFPGGLLNFGQVAADFRGSPDLTITYNPLATLGLNSSSTAQIQAGDASLLFAGVAFELTATDSNGAEVTQFDPPYTLTINYEDWQWQNAGIGSEESLNLYWNSGQGWEPILPCQGCSHDPDNNVMTVRLDHLTEFALLGESRLPLYLPIVLK